MGEDVLAEFFHKLDFPLHGGRNEANGGDFFGFDEFGNFGFNFRKKLAHEFPVLALFGIEQKGAEFGFAENFVGVEVEVKEFVEMGASEGSFELGEAVDELVGVLLAVFFVFSDDFFVFLGVEFGFEAVFFAPVGESFGSREDLAGGGNGEIVVRDKGGLMWGKMRF
jgi:hypothetical protein